MSAKKISELAAIPAVGLEDLCIVEQTEGIITTTYKATVRQLLGCVVPEPNITLLTWSSGPKTLSVKADNLLPNSIIFVDAIMYKIDSYTIVALPNYEAVISIPAGLEAGEHTCVVVNGFVHESSDNFTV